MVNDSYPPSKTKIERRANIDKKVQVWNEIMQIISPDALQVFLGKSPTENTGFHHYYIILQSITLSSSY